MVDPEYTGAAPEPNFRSLLPVANELERWIRALPTWSDQSSEAWETYSRRHAKLQQEIVKRLERMPGCTLTKSKSGAGVTLLLAGVEVRSHTGVTGACRDWINRVRTGAEPKGRA